MGPAVFAVSVAQISLIINTNIASHLATGSVTWLDFADRLMEFPTALLGVALGTVLLPSLSRAIAEGTERRLQPPARLGTALELPDRAAGRARARLARRADRRSPVRGPALLATRRRAQTSVALVGYAVGLMGLITVKILAPGFYAKGDIRTPVKIAVGVLIATQVANIVARARCWPTRDSPCRSASERSPTRRAVPRLAPPRPVSPHGRLGGLLGARRALPWHCSQSLFGWPMAWMWTALQSAPWQRAALLGAGDRQPATSVYFGAPLALGFRRARLPPGMPDDGARRRLHSCSHAPAASSRCSRRPSRLASRIPATRSGRHRPQLGRASCVRASRPTCPPRTACGMLNHYLLRRTGLPPATSATYDARTTATCIAWSNGARGIPISLGAVYLEIGRGDRAQAGRRRVPRRTSWSRSQCREGALLIDVFGAGVQCSRSRDLRRRLLRP